ncbi:MAG: hypothetical protein ACQEQL_03565 [Pseudomonadota bacterium]
MIFSAGLTVFLISVSLFTAFLSGIAGMAGGMILMTLIGTTLSKSMLKRISDHQFYTGTRILVTCIGMIYLWKGINLLQQGEFGI